VINKYMKINVFVNEIFYKSMDLTGQERYNPKSITDNILAEKNSGLLDSKFLVDDTIAVRIEKVSG
jgi:hypothetical protein